MLVRNQIHTDSLAVNWLLGSVIEYPMIVVGVALLSISYRTLTAEENDE